VTTDASRGATRTVAVTREDGAVVCERCVLATSMLPRMKGLLGRKELPPGEGIYLRPASSIHMFFMRFPIDAVFLDRDLVVRKVARGLKPWRIASARGSRSVIELAAGEAARRGIETGQRLKLGEP
jgi:uncharacterized membrane protein (UPF0127 family)